MTAEVVIAPAAGGFGTPCDRVLLDDRVVPACDAALSVHAHAVSYGTGTFEGIRAWRNEDRRQLYLLEQLAHYERKQR